MRELSIVIGCISEFSLLQPTFVDLPYGLVDASIILFTGFLNINSLLMQQNKASSGNDKTP